MFVEATNLPLLRVRQGAQQCGLLVDCVAPPVRLEVATHSIARKNATKPTSAQYVRIYCHAVVLPTFKCRLAEGKGRMAVQSSVGSLDPPLSQD